MDKLILVARVALNSTVAFVTPWAVAYAVVLRDMIWRLM